MRAIIKVMPREGLQVRTPDGSILPPQGAEVERSSWWIRRERDGDVSILMNLEENRREKEL